MSETTKSTALVSGETMTLATAGSLWLDKGAFEHIQRIARMFAESDMVPTAFKGKLPDCAIAVQLAFRLDIDPFALIQRMYVVHGRPGIEAQVVIALVNRRGPFTGPIQWAFTGQTGAESRACTAFATVKATGERAEVTIDWKTVKAEGWLDKPGSKWRTMPDQMFRYRTATWLARLYCPDVIMGMHTADELADIAAIPTTARHVNGAPARDGETIAPGPMRPAAEPEAVSPATTAEVAPDGDGLPMLSVSEIKAAITQAGLTESRVVLALIEGDDAWLRQGQGLGALQNWQRHELVNSIIPKLANGQ